MGAKEWGDGVGRKSMKAGKSAPLAADISGRISEYRRCNKNGIETLTGTALLSGRGAGRSAG